MLRQILSLFRRIGLGAYPASAAFVGIATLMSYFVFGITSYTSLPLIYLIAIILSAQRFGLWPSIMASVLSILAWDYFFTLPYFQFVMSDERDVFALVIFLIVALIVSGMTVNIQHQNKQLGQLANKNARLYAFSQNLATLDTIEKIESFSASYLFAMLKRDVIVILNDRSSGAPIFVFPPDAIQSDNDKLTYLDLAAEIQLSDSTLSTVTRDFAYFPLNALRGRIGALRVAGTSERPVSPEEKQMIMAVLDQVAMAIERIWLAQEHEASSLSAETERVRNALLISVSHDLRTPLTAIIGSLSTLESLDKAYNDTENELTSIALAEAQRLDRFIGNLLDITKLELGGLDVKTSPVNIDDVLESVLERAQPLLQNHRTAVQIPDTLPAVEANYVLLEQVIFNLIDNAGKYSPIDTEIRICAHSADKEVVIEVADQGSGIPDQLSPVIFQKFARLAHGDAKPPGTGLGLAIAKGFVEAMKGTIVVANRLDSCGAIFTIRLPAVLPSPDRVFPV